jgi:hypothetical protein
VDVATIRSKRSTRIDDFVISLLPPQEAAFLTEQQYYIPLRATSLGA